MPIKPLQVQTQLANHVAAVGPAIMIGTLCGLLGMVFTVLNLKVMRLRDATLQVRRPVRGHHWPGLIKPLAPAIRTVGCTLVWPMHTPYIGKTALQAVPSGGRHAKCCALPCCLKPQQASTGCCFM